MSSRDSSHHALFGIVESAREVAVSKKRRRPSISICINENNTSNSHGDDCAKVNVDGLLQKNAFELSSRVLRSTKRAASTVAGGENSTNNCSNSSSKRFHPVEVVGSEGNRRYMIPKTGRMSFGTTESVRKIFKPAPARQTLATLGVSMEALQVAGTGEKTEAGVGVETGQHLQSNNTDGANRSSGGGSHSSTTGIVNNSNKNNSTSAIDSSSTAVSVVTGTIEECGKREEEQNCTQKTKAVPQQQKYRQQQPRSKAHSSSSSSSASHYSSTTQMNSHGTAGSGTVGTAGRHSGALSGRAAAMAKMAMLGEEWAEEEELPGMVAAAGGGPAGGGGGGVGVNAKEMSKVNSRQRKVAISKKK